MQFLNTLTILSSAALASAAAADFDPDLLNFSVWYGSTTCEGEPSLEVAVPGGPGVGSGCGLFESTVKSINITNYDDGCYCKTTFLK